MSGKTPPAMRLLPTLTSCSREALRTDIDPGTPTVVFLVYCRNPAGPLDQDIRYGIAVTIEAGEGIPVYEEVRARLAVPLTARAP